MPARCRLDAKSRSSRIVDRPPRPGGQQQLAAVEQSGDPDAVGDVHPAHGGVECGSADDHVGFTLLHRRLGEHVSHRQKDGSRRTICPITADLATF